MESIEYRNQFFFRWYISDTKPSTKKNMKISVSEMRSEWSQKKRHENRTRQLKQSRQLLKRALTHTRSAIFYETRKKNIRRQCRFQYPMMVMQHHNTCARVRTIDKVNLLQFNTWGNLRAKHKFVVFFICRILFSCCCGFCFFFTRHTKWILKLPLDDVNYEC